MSCLAGAIAPRVAPAAEPSAAGTSPGCRAGSRLLPRCSIHSPSLEIRAQLFGWDVFRPQISPAYPLSSPSSDQPLIVVGENLAAILLGIVHQILMPQNYHRVTRQAGPPVRASGRQGGFFKVVDSRGPFSFRPVVFVNARRKEFQVKTNGSMRDARRAGKQSASGEQRNHHRRDNHQRKNLTKGHPDAHLLRVCGHDQLVPPT